MPDFPDYPDYPDYAEYSRGADDTHPTRGDDTAQSGPPPGDYPPPFEFEHNYSAAKPAWTSGRIGSKKGAFGNWPASPPRRVTGRMLPATREDRVLRLLLTQANSWDRLSAPEHQVLLGLPAPHGPLFAWFEAQLHEHGPQPWAALREGLRGHTHERHAVVQISQMIDSVQPDWHEVRSILTQLLELQKQAKIASLVANADDTAVMQQLRELMAQTPGKTAA